MKKSIESTIHDLHEEIMIHGMDLRDLTKYVADMKERLRDIEDILKTILGVDDDE